MPTKKCCETCAWRLYKNVSAGVLFLDPNQPDWVTYCCYTANKRIVIEDDPADMVCPWWLQMPTPVNHIEVGRYFSGRLGSPDTQVKLYRRLDRETLLDIKDSRIVISLPTSKDRKALGIRYGRHKFCQGNWVVYDCSVQP